MAEHRNDGDWTGGDCRSSSPIAEWQSEVRYDGHDSNACAPRNDCDAPAVQRGTVQERVYLPVPRFPPRSNLHSFIFLYRVGVQRFNSSYHVYSGGHESLPSRKIMIGEARGRENLPSFARQRQRQTQGPSTSLGMTSTVAVIRLLHYYCTFTALRL